MSWAGAVVLWPLAAAALLAAVPRRQWGMWINFAAAAGGLLLACWLPFVAGEPGFWLHAGPVAVHMVLLDGFIGVAAAWFSLSVAPPGRLRLYHALFQGLLGLTNLALLADNAALTALALEGAALILVVATLLPGTQTPAAWRVLLLAGGALVLAAAGTMLLYLAALPALGPGWDALRWTALTPTAAQCNGRILSLAFVLLLLGYGGLAGLVPLQSWLLDLQAAPVALGGVLGGAVPGAALVVILRLRGLLDGNAQAVPPGGPMLLLGLATLLVCAAGLWRAPCERRLLALSSAGQSGVVAFAFGLGGAAATLAGVLHLTAHALARAAGFQARGRIGGGLARAALVGLPPFGLFGSVVLIVQQAAQRSPWLVVPLGAGLAASAGALVVRMPAVAAGAGGMAVAGMWACLAGALLLGLAMPPALADWLLGLAAVAQ